MLECCQKIASHTKTGSSIHKRESHTSLRLRVRPTPRDNRETRRISRDKNTILPQGRPLNTSDLPYSADDRYEALLADYKESSRRWRRVLASTRKVRRLLAYACGLCLLASYFYVAKGFLIAAAVAFTVFSLVMPIQNRVQRLLVYASDLALINQLGLARRRRRWDLLPDTYADDPIANSQLGSDLDLFGAPMSIPRRAGARSRTSTASAGSCFIAVIPSSSWPSVARFWTWPISS